MSIPLLIFKLANVEIKKTINDSFDQFSKINILSSYWIKAYFIAISSEQCPYLTVLTKLTLNLGNAVLFYFCKIIISDNHIGSFILWNLNFRYN